MPRGVVAMLDALGVMGMWARSSPEDVERQVRDWRTIVAVFNESAERANTVSTLVQRCRVYAFSDTVFITMEGRSRPVLGQPDLGPQPNEPELLMLMGQMLAPAFYAALHVGIYFRGAIATGDFYEGLVDPEPLAGAAHASQPLLIGPAIDNAAEWYEQADWMGVLATPNASYGLDLWDSSGGDVRLAYHKCDVPMKPGRDGVKSRSLWALAWPRTAADEEGDAQAARARVLSVFAGRPIGIAPTSKYENTLAFFDDCIKLEEPS